MNFSKNYCSFDKLHQILDTVFHQSVLQNSAVLFLSHLKGFFPRKLMKVLSLSFTSNREDMFDLDSMCNSYCDCANKLDRMHRQVIRMVCAKHVIHLPKRQ